MLEMGNVNKIAMLKRGVLSFIACSSFLLAGCGSADVNKIQNTPAQALQIFPPGVSKSELARKAAESDPKKLGEQVCKSLISPLWGEFIMVGIVGAIGQDYLMRIDLERIQMKHVPKITQKNYPKNLWAMQNEWYRCQDPIK